MFHLTSMSTGKRITFPCSEMCSQVYLWNLFYTTTRLPFYASYILFLSRGMKFENVQILTDAISDIITDMKWAWWVSRHLCVFIRKRNAENMITRTWLKMYCIILSLCLFCQGGPSRSHLQARGNLQSQLYGLSGQDQRGSSCCCSCGDGATGQMFSLSGSRKRNKHTFLTDVFSEWAFIVKVTLFLCPAK